MNPVEIWTGASFLGALVSAWAFNHACADYEAISSEDDGNKRLVARLAQLRELGRMIAQGSALPLGVHALPNGDAVSWNASIAVLIFMAVILAVNSLLDAAGRLVDLRP